MTSILRNSVTNTYPGITLISVLLSVSVLTGCGEKAAATQVAAKVNSEEITVSQVNNALANVPPNPGKAADELRKDVLDNLIVQKLADQQAIKMKLDRAPAVMQAIENARNTILARAYMDPILAASPKPTPEDIHKFYADHPELFSDRHIYSLRELEAAAKPGLGDSVRELVGKGEGLDAIAAQLKEKNIPSAIQSGVKPAEQLPLEMLPKIGKLSAGQLMVVELSKSISVLQVVSSKVEPVEESKASAFIQDFLVNERKKQVVEKEIKALKAEAKIEYVGENEVKTAAAETPEKSAEQPVTPAVKSINTLK